MLRGKQKEKLYDKVVLRALGFTFTCVDYADGWIPVQERNAASKSIAGVARSMCLYLSTMENCLPLKMAAWHNAPCMYMCGT